jgi:hypothetical protein
LVLGKAINVPKGFVCRNFSTSRNQHQFWYGPPKGCKRNEKFWVKVQNTNGVECWGKSVPLWPIQVLLFPLGSRKCGTCHNRGTTTIYWTDWKLLIWMKSPWWITIVHFSKFVRKHFCPARS